MRARVEQQLAAVPFAGLLGLRVERATADAVCLRLPYRDASANRNRTMHGGVTASLIDVAAALVAAGEGPASGRTLDLDVRYLAPAVGEDVVAEARLLRRGAAIAAVTVEVRTLTATVVATGLVSRLTATGRGLRLDRAPAPVAFAGALDRPVGSASPFTAHLGVASKWIARGVSVAVVPYRADLTDADGRLHEGVLASATDTAGGGASWSSIDFDAEARASTLGLHLGFHAPALGEDVAVEAHNVAHDQRVFQNVVTLRGRRTGGLVASGWITYRIARPAQPTAP